MSSHKVFRISHPKPDITLLPMLGMDKEHITHDFKHYYSHRLGRDEHCRSPEYAYKAISLAISDRMVERWKRTYNLQRNQDGKNAFYLSMEFLLGRRLSNAVMNLGVDNEVAKGLYDLGLVMEELVDAEPDAGLGNGGLGRLAACFIDSCATLNLPVTGYGLR